MNINYSKSEKIKSKEKNIKSNKNITLSQNSTKEEYYKNDIECEENLIFSNDENEVNESFIGKKRVLNNTQKIHNDIFQEKNLKENNVQKLTKMKNKTNHKKNLADTNTYNLIHLESLFNDKENIFSFYVILINKKISKFGFICYISIDYPIFFLFIQKLNKLKSLVKFIKLIRLN